MVKCKSCKHLQLLDDQYYWCELINDSPDIDAERDCDCFKRATNHDIIRRLPTERMVSLYYNSYCPHMNCFLFAANGNDWCDKYDDCYTCLADWVKSETTDKDLKEILREADE